MYNGIGLQSVRGTGTSGHVQRNVAALRGSARRAQRPRVPTRNSLHATLRGRLGERMGTTPAFAAHENRRKVEVAVAELEEELEARGYEKDTIEEMKKRLREDLLARDEQEKKGEKDREIEHGKLRREEGRGTAAAAAAAPDVELTDRRNDLVKEALGVGEDYREGDFLRRMREDKDKEKEPEPEREKEAEADAGKQISPPASNVVALKNKDMPNGEANAVEKVANGAGERPERLPDDTPADMLSGSESSVLTPSSPSSASLSQGYAEDEENDVPPRRPPSPTVQKRQRGGGVLLEESVRREVAPKQKRDEATRPLPAASGDSLNGRRRGTSPSDSCRDKTTRGDSYRDMRERDDDFRDVNGNREHGLSDSSDSLARRRYLRRRDPREYSVSPRRYRRSFRRRRETRSRRSRYSDEDDLSDSYDSESSYSRSRSPFRRRRSLSPPRRHRGRSVSPPRKRYRKDYYDSYSRRTPSKSRWGEKERDYYRSYSRDRSRSPVRSVSHSPRREYQRSLSPKRYSRRDEHRRRRNDDSYDLNRGYRHRGSYRRGYDRRDWYRLPSPDGWDSSRAPSVDRYRSPSADRYREWHRDPEPEHRDNRSEYKDAPRALYEKRPRARDTEPERRDKRAEYKDAPRALHDERPRGRYRSVSRSESPI